jgi:hypothetical protein
MLEDGVEAIRMYQKNRLRAVDVWKILLIHDFFCPVHLFLFAFSDIQRV